MTEQHQNKMLLLHGGHQTGEVLLGRIAKLRKKLSKKANENGKSKAKKHPNHNEKNDIKIVTPLQIIAPDGPFESNIKELMKIWWTRIGENADCEYKGLEKTINILHDLWNSSEATFKGIFAFSQGARLAHLISVLHCNSNGSLFPGLEFVVFVSGYYAPLPSNFPPNAYAPNLNDDILKEENLSIPSLHIIGKRDQLITPEQSYVLASKYQQSVIHEHQMGHCVPMKAADLKEMLSFIAAALDKTTLNDIASTSQNSETYILPDEEHVQIQIEECESLELIYPEQFKLQSSFQYNDPNDPEEGKQYSHPICYTMSLENDNASDDNENDFYPAKPLALQVLYTTNYPDEKPKLSLQHDMNLLEFKVIQEKACLQVVERVAEAELGMPCIMSCFLAIKEFIDEEGLINSLIDDGTNKISEFEDKKEDSISDSDAIEMSQQYEFLPAASRERIENCDEQGQKIAELVFQKCTNITKHSQELPLATDAYSAQMNSSMNKTSKGGEWKYTIGLVGKPSAGKSTFFNAATAFARQRNDDVGKEVGDEGNITIFGASMAPHPFTTIDPNIGFCLVPAPPGACPEDKIKQNLKGNGRAVHETLGTIGSTHGRDNEGRRLVPVTLKDVAGLVPGAYQGRGKGNKVSFYILL